MRSVCTKQETMEVKPYRYFVSHVNCLYWNLVNDTTPNWAIDYQIQFLYLDAAKFLYIHRILVQPTDRNYLNGIWGKLASEILMQNWDAALEDLKRLQQFIDESTFGSSLQLLQQRTWLIHWSLFVFFNHPKGRDLIIELFLYQKQYLNAIQTTCPWILRYLSTAVIINKNSRWVVCWCFYFKRVIISC